MPRSSKALLSDETLHELESQFYSFIDSLSSDERKKFFAEFLTNEEKMMMYKRLALYWCLLEGYSLAKIQQMIGVTHDTTRVYNKKKNILSEEFKSLVRRIAKSDVIDQSTQKQPEPIEETHEEQQEAEPQVVEEVIETETVEETVMTEPTEEEKPTEEAKEEETTEEKQTESSEEKSEAPVEDDQNNIWAVEHKDEDTEEKETEEKKEEASGMMPTESKDEDKEASDSEEGGEKKKSGIAKFFGF